MEGKEGEQKREKPAEEMKGRRTEETRIHLVKRSRGERERVRKKENKRKRCRKGKGTVDKKGRAERREHIKRSKEGREGKRQNYMYYETKE